MPFCQTLTRRIANVEHSTFDFLALLMKINRRQTDKIQANATYSTSCHSKRAKHSIYERIQFNQVRTHDYSIWQIVPPVLRNFNLQYIAQSIRKQKKEKNQFTFDMRMSGEFFFCFVHTFNGHLNIISFEP